jgi:DNA-binding transcriptional ArsR family regulator
MVNRQADPLDAVFGALSHPARRRMLERLSAGAASVGELAEPFRMSAPAISRHVRVLEHAGLVVRERDGRLHRMDMEGGTLAAALRWMDTQHRFWSARLDRLGAFLEQPTQEEKPVWPRRNPPPEPRSGSSARTPRHPRKSSKRSRRPKH